MGGGAIFRGVGRIMGAATIGAAVAPTTGAFCHVQHAPSDFLKDQGNCSIMLSHSQKDIFDINVNDKELALCADSQWKTEGIALEKNGFVHLCQTTLDSPPTEDEVEEATTELQAALSLAFEPEGNSSGYYMDLQNDDGHEDFTSPHARGNDVSTQSHHQLGKFAREAFQLLQRNPKVQDAVKSLACDPAVWRAVMNNEKVLELAQEAQSTEASGDEHIVRKKDIEMFASKFYGFVTRRTTGYYEYIKESLFSILQNMFGFIGKPEGMKGNNSSKDKTVTSCMMLAVAVVIVVVVGRHSKRHYK